MSLYRTIRQKIIFMPLIVKRLVFLPIILLLVCVPIFSFVSRMAGQYKVAKLERDKYNQAIAENLKLMESISIDDDFASSYTTLSTANKSSSSNKYASKTLVVVSESKYFNNYGATDMAATKNMYVLTYNTEKDTEKAYMSLLQDDSVIYVETDGRLNAQSEQVTDTQTTTTSKSSETQLKKYLDKLDRVKDNIKVAILDSGINVDDELYLGRIVDTNANYSTTGQKNSISDDNGHGNKMAEIIAKNSDALLMPIKVADSDGNSSIVGVYMGIKKAIENEADVINISFTSEDEKQSAMIASAIMEANEKGIIVVVSAGNDSKDIEKIVPSNIDEAIVVSAIEKDNSFAKYSNYGQYIDYCSYGSYKDETGTSIASANVCGIIASILEKGKDVSILDGYAIDLGKDGKDEQFGKGLIAMNLNSDILSDYVPKTGLKYINWKNLTDEQLNALLMKATEKELAEFVQSLSQEDLAAIILRNTILISEHITYAGANGSNITNTEAEQGVVEKSREIYYEYLLGLDISSSQLEDLVEIANPVIKGVDTTNLHVYYDGERITMSGQNSHNFRVVSITPSQSGNILKAYFTKPANTQVISMTFEDGTGRYNYTAMVDAAGKASYSNKGTLSPDTHDLYQCISNVANDNETYNQYILNQVDIPVTTYGNNSKYTITLGDGTQRELAYTVTFKDGDQIVNTQSVARGGSATPPSLTKEGYVLSWDKAFTNITEDVVVSAVWTQTNSTSYRIVYNLNGGTLRGAPSSYTNTTSSFTLPTPQKTGYTFTGWTGSNGNSPSRAVRIEKGSTGDRTYTANWTPVIYAISYDLGGGTENTNPGNYSIESLTFTLRNPVRTGFVFAGWTGSNGSTPEKTVTISSGSTGNRIYTANWIENTYSIVFNGQGATSGNMPAQTFYYSQSQALRKNQFERVYVVSYEENGGNNLTDTRVAYDFLGWNTGAAGTGLPFADQEPVKELVTGGTVTLYAQWRQKSFTLPAPTYAGHVFQGWYLDEALTQRLGDAGAEAYTTGNVTLYAKWSNGTYNIAYNGNGAVSGNPYQQVNIQYGANVTIKQNEFERFYTVQYETNGGNAISNGVANYTFTHWNTNSNGLGTSYNAGQVTTNVGTSGTVTLYAQWASGAVTLPTPTKNGHTFEGWYSDAGLTHRVGGAGSSYTPTSSIVLYAKWN